MTPTTSLMEQHLVHQSQHKINYLKILGYCSRKRPYGYIALKGTFLGKPKPYFQKKATFEEERDTALMYCSFYLRSKTSLHLVEHLSEIGSRYGRQWFLLQDDNSIRKLLCLTKVANCSTLQLSSSSLKVVEHLFALLKHPYICVVEDIGFQVDQQQIFTIMPFFIEGSLKDYIYRCPSTSEWSNKYSPLGQRLPIAQAQRFGRQILSGILYLRNRGFSWIGHIHTGNIMVENGVCKISGYENTLMAVSVKLEELLGRICLGNMKHFDILSFGHVMYEMAAGCELESAIPTVDDYYMVQNQEMESVLHYIFNDGSSGYPSLKKINFHPFFNSAPLSEVASVSPVYNDVPASVKVLLKSAKNSKVLHQYPYLFETSKLWINPRKVIDRMKRDSFTDSTRASGFVNYQTLPVNNEGLNQIPTSRQTKANLKRKDRAAKDKEMMSFQKQPQMLMEKSKLLAEQE